MKDNNFDEIEFLDLEELDNSDRPSAPGTANQINYNALLKAEITTEDTNMDFVEERYVEMPEKDNFIVRSFESTDDIDYLESSSDTFDEEDEAELARRKRIAARKRAEKRRLKKKKMLIRRAIFITAFLVFITSAVLLVKSLFDYARGDKIYEDIQNQIFIIDDSNSDKPGNNTTNATTETSAGEITSPEDVLLTNYNHDSLIALNSDAVGYLQIPAIDILLPVVQGDDNEYYLSHTLTGESSKNGTLFIDSRDELGIESQNTIIYGHNMKNGSMFGQLDKFMDSKFFSTGYNKYMYFYIEDQIYKYEIYSVHTTPAVGETYSIIFPTDDIFFNYYNNMVKASYHKTDITITENSHTMTLSTCTNDDATRLVVQAVRVDELDQ